MFVSVVHGTPENTEIIAKHCRENINARVFTPQRGEVVDATSETHIYQVSNVATQPILS